MSNRLQEVMSEDGSEPNMEELSLLKHLVLGEEQSALKLVREQVKYLEQILRRQEVRFANALKSQEHALKTQEDRILNQFGPAAMRYFGGLSESVERYEEVGQIMAGPFEAALRVSASQNREGLAHTLAPVIGPGIRSSVAEFFRRFVEQLDALLRGANLPQRLWWRVLAARQGVPYSEYVLSRTARYAVLLVQLIEKSSGEVICEVGNRETTEQAASFTSQSMLANTLLRQSVPEWESIRLSGQRMALQVRVLGGGGEPMRRRAGNLLSKCEEELREASLNELSPAHVKRLKTTLLPLLATGKPKRSNPWIGSLVVISALGAFAWWSFTAWKRHTIEKEFLSQLAKSPGLVVTTTSHEGDKLIVRGLRDPLAPDPKKLAGTFFNEPDSVAFDLAPYFSVGTEFERLRQAEQERTGAEATKALWEKAEQQRADLEFLASRQDAAIKARLTTALGGTLPETITLEWKDDTLQVSGSLPASKLVLLQEEAKRIEPLAKIDCSAVDSVAELPDPRRTIEAMDVPFITGTLQLDAKAPAMLQQIVERMQALDAASPHERKYRLRAWPITGEHMDGNIAMQLTRLSMVRAQMQAMGYPTSKLDPGVTESESLSGRMGVWVEVLPE